MVDLRTLLLRAGIGAAIFGIFFLILAAGFRVKAGRALADARAAEARGDTDAAVAGYDLAIRHHYPFSGAGREARDRLLAMAEEYEKRGQPDAARQTYQTLLSALCAVESGLSANRALIERLEAKVAALLPLPSHRPDPTAPGNPADGLIQNPTPQLP